MSDEKLRLVLDAAPMCELKAAIVRKRARLRKAAEAAEAAAKRAAAALHTRHDDAEIFLRYAAAHVGETVGAILGKCRKEPLSTRRHIIQAAARKVLGLPYQELGRLFQRADHTSLIYAYRRVDTTPPLRIQRDELIAAWNAHLDTTPPA